MKPLRALSHPLWMSALALLILNDHFLKGSGLWPPALTGKLSDVAGLIAAPAILAVVLGVRSRAGALLAHLAVGAGFTAINVSTAIARWVEAVSAHTPLPWQITVDPTDLMTLPALALGFVAFVRVTERPRDGERDRIAKVATALGSLACVATSYPTEPAGTSPVPGSLAVANGTAGERLLRVRHLKTSVLVDCDGVTADPTTILSRHSFDEAEAWLVEPGRAVVLETERDCDAALIDGDGIPMTLIYWTADDFPETTLTTVAANVLAERLISFDFEDHALVTPEHPAVFAPPPPVDAEAVGACAVPSAELGVAWSLPLPDLSQTILDIVRSPDGCAALELDGAPTFYVCVPDGALPFEVGDQVSIRSGSTAGAEVLDIVSETASMRVVKGGDVARWSDDASPFSIDVEPIVDCEGGHDECGSHLVPVEISIYGDAVDEITFLRSGDAVELDDNSRLTVVRAASSVAVDTACTPWSSGPLYFETVLSREEI